jgi:2,4-dichlorophenol 6-monooxygenase
LDLVTTGPAVLATAPQWAGAASAAGVGYTAVEPDGEWAKAAGLRPGGAVLVRPDGIVAWHCPELPADSAAALAEAVRQVTFS